MQPDVKSEVPQGDPKIAKPRKPWGKREAAPAPVLTVDVVTKRKPFTRKLTINVGTRKFLVIGGLWPTPDSDGRRPYVAPQQIAKRLGLDMRDCLMADPREIGKIEAGRAAELKVYTVEDMR